MTLAIVIAVAYVLVAFGAMFMCDRTLVKALVRPLRSKSRTGDEAAPSSSHPRA